MGLLMTSKRPFRKEREKKIFDEELREYIKMLNDGRDIDSWMILELNFVMEIK